MEAKTLGETRTAAERREMVIAYAISEFSRRGLHGTATEDIARRAGISQPYIFRLFGTKKDLFLAATERVCDRITALLTEVVQSEGEDALSATGRAHFQLLSDREEFLLLLQAIAAAHDPEVRQVIGARFQQIFDQTQDAAQVATTVARAYIAFGLLHTAVLALDLPGALGYAACWAFMREHLQTR